MSKFNKLIFQGLLVLVTFMNLGYAQQRNPSDYPSSDKWHDLPLVAQDTVVKCMKYYFLSNDTIFFREAPSEQIYKLALAEIGETDIFYGKDMQFNAQSLQTLPRKLNGDLKGPHTERYLGYYQQALPVYYSQQPVVDRRQLVAEKQEDTLQSVATPAPEIKQYAVFDTSISFHSSESGFITTGGCKVSVYEYLGCSDGRYYFSISDDKKYYYLDRSEVFLVHQLNIGKDYHLQSVLAPRFWSSVWRAAVVVGGPVLIIGAASAMGWMTSSGAVAVVTGGMGIGVFIVVAKDAFKRAKRAKAYKFAAPYVCS